MGVAEVAEGGFCPRCGAPHDGSAKFCANCGAKLDSVAAPASAPSSAAPTYVGDEPPRPAAPPPPPPPPPPPAPYPSYPQPPAQAPYQQAPAQMPYPQQGYPQQGYPPPQYEQPQYQQPQYQQPGAQRALGLGSVKILPLVGAIAVLVSTFLPWFDAPGGSANAFDVPFSFLFSPETAQDSGFSLGIVLLLAAGAGAATAFLSLPGLVRRAAGAVGALVSGGFAAQIFRLASDAGQGGDAFQLLGIGAYVGIAGGAILLWSR